MIYGQIMEKLNILSCLQIKGQETDLLQKRENIRR